jgi:hypothetical protein
MLDPILARAILIRQAMLAETKRLHQLPSFFEEEVAVHLNPLQQFRLVKLHLD